MVDQVAITQLPNDNTPLSTDVYVLVDTTDHSQAPSGTTKKMNRSNFLAGIVQSVNNLSDLNNYPNSRNNLGCGSKYLSYVINSDLTLTNPCPTWIETNTTAIINIIMPVMNSTLPNSKSLSDGQFITIRNNGSSNIVLKYNDGSPIGGGIIPPNMMVELVFIDNNTSNGLFNVNSTFLSPTFNYVTINNVLYTDSIQPVVDGDTVILPYGFTIQKILGSGTLSGVAFVASGSLQSPSLEATTLGSTLFLQNSNGPVNINNNVVNANGVVNFYAGIQFNENVVSGTVSVTTSHYYINVDTSSVSTTLTLPASPVAGQTYFIKDITGSALTHNITINGNGNNIDGGSTLTINSNYYSVQIEYNGTSWSVVSNYNTAGSSGYLLATNNLSDVASTATSLSNLGLGGAILSTSSATTYNLNNPVPSYVEMNFTASGQKLVMPASNVANSLNTTGGAKCRVYNSGSNSFNIVAQDGSTSIYSGLLPGETIDLYLISHVTANGGWHTNTVLGSIASQQADNVTIGGGAMDNVEIGLVKPNVAVFTYNESYKVISDNITVYEGFIPFDCSGGSLTFTMDAAPAAGEFHTFKDDTGSAGTHNVTINGNGKNIDGSSTYIINNNYAAVTIIYNGTQWNIV